jgi:hypothetical protein
MRNTGVNALHLFLAFIVGFSSADCSFLDGKHTPDGRSGGTGGGGGCAYGGASYGQTDAILFDNGNIAACTLPTDTSVFTLASASTVTSLRLWTNTNTSGQAVSYTLLGPTGLTLSAGPTTKGGCDPYQTNWCEFLASPTRTRSRRGRRAVGILGAPVPVVPLEILQWLVLASQSA